MYDYILDETRSLCITHMYVLEKLDRFVNVKSPIQNITLTLFKTKCTITHVVVIPKKDFVSASQMPNILISFKVFTRTNNPLYRKSGLQQLGQQNFFLVTLVCVFILSIGTNVYGQLSVIEYPFPIHYNVANAYLIQQFINTLQGCNTLLQ